MAVANSEVMAERMWNWWHKKAPIRIGNAKSARAYRSLLVEKECGDFQLIWDIHDGHKHVELSRPNRKVTSAAQTGIEITGRVFQPDVFQKSAFQVGTEKFLVKLDDGTERDIAEVLENVLKMWTRLVFEN